VGACQSLARVRNKRSKKFSRHEGDFKRLYLRRKADVKERCKPGAAFSPGPTSLCGGHALLLSNQGKIVYHYGLLAGGELFLRLGRESLWKDGRLLSGRDYTGANHLHHHVLHRDLKPENILLSRTDMRDRFWPRQGLFRGRAFRPKATTRGP
jgi:serine/threonine protein kinase